MPHHPLHPLLDVPHFGVDLYVVVAEPHGQTRHVPRTHAATRLRSVCMMLATSSTVWFCLCYLGIPVTCCNDTHLPVYVAFFMVFYWLCVTFMTERQRNLEEIFTGYHRGYYTDYCLSECYMLVEG